MFHYAVACFKLKAIIDIFLTAIMLKSGLISKGGLSKPTKSPAYRPVAIVIQKVLIELNILLLNYGAKS